MAVTLLDGVMKKPLTTGQRGKIGTKDEYKCKRMLVMCGNLAFWGEQSTTTTTLDVPLLRILLSLTANADTTFSSIDITSAFLNAEIDNNHTVLVTSSMLSSPKTVRQVKKAI